MVMYEYMTQQLRGYLDVSLVLVLITLEACLIAGVQSQGVQTSGFASALWSTSLLVMVLVVLRWALLLPSMRAIFEWHSKLSLQLGARIWPRKKGRDMLRDMLDRWDDISQRRVIIGDRGELVFVDVDGKPLKSKKGKKMRVKPKKKG